MRMGELPGVLDAEAAWRALWQAASEPYRKAGRFAWHFARGKLSRDPVFRALLERGDFSGARRVLDIGCGQGLLASLLAQAALAQLEDRWPVSWPATPRDVSYTGVELMPRDVERARRALGALGDRATFVCADVRASQALPASDAVVILDVLHYVAHDEQAHLLRRVRRALAPDAKLLLRVGDAGQRRGWRISQWVDRTVTRLRGHRAAPTWGRTLSEWTALLEEIGFSVMPVPMSRGTPFANVLLVCAAVERPA